MSELYGEEIKETSLADETNDVNERIENKSRRWEQDGQS